MAAISHHANICRMQKEAMGYDPRRKHCRAATRVSDGSIASKAQRVPAAFRTSTAILKSSSPVMERRKTDPSDRPRLRADFNKSEPQDFVACRKKDYRQAD